MQLLDMLDAEQFVKWYTHFYPLIQEAYDGWAIKIGILILVLFSLSTTSWKQQKSSVLFNCCNSRYFINMPTRLWKRYQQDRRSYCVLAKKRGNRKIQIT